MFLYNAILFDNVINQIFSTLALCHFSILDFENSLKETPSTYNIILQEYLRINRKKQNYGNMFYVTDFIL